MLKGTNIGTQTSTSGHYTMRNLPVGTFEVVATSMGYKESSIKLELKKGESYEANFQLMIRSHDPEIVWDLLRRQVSRTQSFVCRLSQRFHRR